MIIQRVIENWHLRAVEDGVLGDSCLALLNLPLHELMAEMLGKILQRSDAARTINNKYHVSISQFKML